MKHMNKRLLAALLAVAMTLPAFSCGEKIPSGDESTAEVSDSANESSNEESSNAESSKGNADSADSDSSSKAANNEDSVEINTDDVVIDENGAQNHKLVFETPELLDDEPVVSTKRAEDGSVYVAKTDINGVVVTEANGSEATELYTGETNAALYEKDYTPSIKTYQAYWLDISKKQDFVFDGSLLEFEIQVKENTPNGIYPVEVYFADLSNYSANTDENAAKLDAVKFIPGYVCVNTDQPEVPATGTEMTLRPETISAQPGETVRMKLLIENNPGLVAFVIRMHYDDNAIVINEAGAGADLGKHARLTTNTLDD